MIDNKKVQVPRRLMTFAAQLQSTNKDTPNPKTRMISIQLNKTVTKQKKKEEREVNAS